MVCYLCQYWWCASMCNVLAWVMSFPGQRATMDGMGDVLRCVTCQCVQHGQGGQCVFVSGMLVLLLLLSLKYYPKEKMLNVYFSNKNVKLFQIDLNSDLNKEPDLKSRCSFTVLESVMLESWMCLNLPKYARMCTNIMPSYV